MRRSRLLGIQPSNHYHCVSRIVNRQWILGPIEKEQLKRWMHELAEFSGIHILSYCILSNHFHLLVEVPQRPAPDQMPDDKELTERIQRGWGTSRAKEFQHTILTLSLQGNLLLAQKIREAWFAQMWNLSSYLKDLKQRFSQWYNQRENRTGTLWECRFHSTLIQNDGHILRAVASYIELNPVRAGIVKDPKEYRWSSYADLHSRKEAGSSPSSIEKLLSFHPSHPKFLPSRPIPSSAETLRIWRTILHQIANSPRSHPSHVTIRRCQGRRGILLQLHHQATKSLSPLRWQEVDALKTQSISKADWVGSLEFVHQAISKQPGPQPPLS